MQQAVSFSDENANGKRGNPAGARACQVWQFIGGPVPPTDPKLFRYQTTDTSSAYIASFDAADGGKTAWYLLRWENERGQPGPWSDVIGAPIKP